MLWRLASYFLTPVIDCGVLLLSSEPSGLLEGINGRVAILTPGSACLICRGRVDQARAATELLTPEERTRRLDEGYAAALPGTEPAVVTFTTVVAAAAVTELLERLTGFGPEPVPSELILRLHDREVSANRQAPRVGHYCDPAAGKLGTGHAEPFLEQMWNALKRLLGRLVPGRRCPRRWRAVRQQQAGDQVHRGRGDRQERLHDGVEALADHLLADFQVGEALILLVVAGGVACLAAEHLGQQHPGHRQGFLGQGAHRRSDS